MRAKWVREEFDRPKIEPPFPQGRNLPFVSIYLSEVANEFFENKYIASVSGMKFHPHLEAICAQGVFNPAFQFEVKVKKREDGGVSEHDARKFFDELSSVFTHEHAVSGIWTAKAKFVDEEEDPFEKGINGTPAGLAVDICQNDLDMAKKVAKKLSLDCPMGWNCD